MSNLKKKAVLLLIILVLAVFLEGLSSNINLLDRAIVVGLAIDRAQDELQLSVQVIIPRNGGSALEGNDFVIYSAKGKTVQEAVENISLLVGLKTSFAHTNVIIFGDSFLKSGKVDVMEFLVQSDMVTDDTLLVASVGNAKDLLSAKMPINEVASYHLTEILKSNRKETGQCLYNFKKYFEDYYKVGGTTFFPLVFMKQGEFDSLLQSGDNQKTNMLDVSHVVVMNREGFVVRLGRTQTNALSYTTDELNGGVLNYKGDDNVDKEVVILRSTCSRKVVDFNTVELSLNFLVRPSYKYASQGESIVAVSVEEQQKIANTVVSQILDCFEVCKANNADIFQLGEEFYREYGKDWLLANDIYYLNDVNLNVNVDINVK